MPDYKLSRPSHSLNLRRVQPLAAKRLGAEAGFLLPTFCFSFAVGEEENKKKKKAEAETRRWPRGISQNNFGGLAAHSLSFSKTKRKKMKEKANARLIPGLYAGPWTLSTFPSRPAGRGTENRCSRCPRRQAFSPLPPHDSATTARA